MASSVSQTYRFVNESTGDHSGSGVGYAFETYALDTTPDNMAPAVGPCPSWARFGGVEFANVVRTKMYAVDSGLLTGGRIRFNEAAYCWIGQQPDGAFLAFDTPANDPAPWFDSRRPESQDFLGFVLSAVTIGSVVTHDSAFKTSRGGGATHVRRHNSRQFVFTGALVSDTCAGLDYGESWLRNVLAGVGCDECEGDVLELRLSCPPDDGSYNDLGYWIAYDVAVVAGPEFSNRMPGCAMEDVTFTLESGVPYLYKPPITCSPRAKLAAGDTKTGQASCMNFDDWLCAEDFTSGCCAVNPPLVGSYGAIVTIEALAGSGPLEIATYANCPPNLAVDEPLTSITIPYLPQGATVVIDSSRQRIDVSVADSTIPITGIFDTSKPLQWVNVESCDDPICVCVRKLYPCTRGFNTFVTVDLQYKEV